MKTMQLNHVALHVQDIDRSCRFYAEVLQLQPIPRPAFDFPGAWFQLGEDQELHLIGGAEEPVRAGSRHNHFALLVDDIGAWENYLQNAGVSFMPRRTRPDGAYQIFLPDPNGHYIELCTPPAVANEMK